MENLEKGLQELKKLLTKSEVGMKNALEENNGDKYLAFSQSWFTILNQISDCRQKINAHNYNKIIQNK
jgi:hypothetical protein